MSKISESHFNKIDQTDNLAELVQQTRQNLHLLLESADDVIAIHDLEWRYLYFTSPPRFHIQPQDILGKTCQCLLSEEESRIIEQNLEKVTRTGQNLTVERKIFWEGKTIWFSDHLFPLQNQQGQIVSIARICRDITERKNAELKLKESLDEKELLLREIHHRVKNNLQLISSLLSLQSSFSSELNTDKALEQCQGRIRTIALVHDSLYQSDNLTRINLADYAQRLASETFYAFSLDPESISLICDCDPVILNIDQAIPCGLLINELISNACRHAFAPGRLGRIELNISNSPKNNINIVVSDNGIGLPDGIDLEKPMTLGFTLVKGLIRQLNAKMTLDVNHGTCFNTGFGRADGTEE